MGMILTDEQRRTIRVKQMRYLIRHPFRMAEEITRKAKFLWWITGIRTPDKIRCTAGIKFFFALRRLLGMMPERCGERRATLWFP